MVCRLHVRGAGTSLAALLALLSSLLCRSSALSLPFLELGTSTAALSGSLRHGDGVNSDPISISIPTGLPFSNETESLIFVSCNGFLSFREARGYGAPEHLFSSDSPYTRILAPHWTSYNNTLGGDVSYEVHVNGSLMDTVNSAISQEVGVAFDGVWLLLVHWNNVPTAANATERNSYQAVVVTDGSRSYALFLYHCHWLQSSGAAIGFSASGNFFQNHRLSLAPSSSDVACGNAPHSNWTNLLYHIHYAGVRAEIQSTPEGPVFRAAAYIDLRCKVVTPGNYLFTWEAYCLEGGSETLKYKSGQNFSDISRLVSVSSTPDSCLDVIVCRAWDESGTTAEARFQVGNITGVGLLNRINSMPNNTGLKADSAHQLGNVSCHSASRQSLIGRWVTPSGEQIPLTGNPMFQIRYHTGTFHSFTTLSLRPGAEFTSEDQGVYSCLIPDENGEEQVLHFGLYPHGFSEVGPAHPLSIRRTSETPFTLSCDSTHLPPYLVRWWQNDSIVSDRHTHSLLTDRHTSSYENILVVAAGNRLAGTTYTCGVGTQVQPYSGGQAEPPATTKSYLSYASVQEVGGHWSLPCSPPDSIATVVTELTWETAEGSEVARSSADSVYYVAEVEDSHHHQELVCRAWVGEERVFALYLTLIVQVPGEPLEVSVGSKPAQPVLGQPLELQCRAKKTLAGLTNQTTASWSHDSPSDVITEGGLLYGSGLTFRDLSFSELRTSHAGVYQCEGHLVTVARDQPLAKKVEKLLHLTIPMATVDLTTPPAGYKFNVGSDLSLTCTATLPPYVDSEVTGVVAWETPSGKVDKDSEKFTLSTTRTGSHTHQFSLKVSSLSQLDGGEYSCSVVFLSASLYLSPSLPSPSHPLIIRIHDDSVDGTSQSVTTATPKATPTSDTPHITNAGVRGRDTGGVAGAIVAMAVIVIVVVAIVITVTFCSLRRKANNRQIYNMDNGFPQEPTYEHPPPPYTSSPLSLTNSTTTHLHLHGNHGLYAVVGNGNGLHLPIRDSSAPPPLLTRNSSVNADRLSPYADSGTYSLAESHTNTDSADEGQSSHTLETANPLYASSDDLDPVYSKITSSGAGPQ